MRRWIIGTLAVVLLSLGSAHAAPIVSIGPMIADSYNPKWSRATCRKTCRVMFSPGGNIETFLKQAAQVKRDRIRLMIDGDCISSCSMAADKARPRTCITHRARFLFHKGVSVLLDSKTENELDKERFDPSEFYSADILAWVKEHGGFPGKDTSDNDINNNFLVMPYEEARRFFRICR